MNPDNQTPSPNLNQPDYSFIVNQPVGPEKNDAKKRDPRIVIILVLFVATMILLVVGILLSAKSQVSEEQSNSSSSNPISEESKSTIDNFYSSIDQNNIDAAYELFSFDTEITKGVFRDEIVPYAQLFKLNECQPKQDIKELIDDEARIIIVYICNTKEANIPVGFEFTLDEGEDGKRTIYNYDLETTDEE